MVRYSLALALICAAPASAATITIINADAPGVGFNDPTSAAPIGGNPGTTRGQQALNAFAYAATAWGMTINSSVEIKVWAQFQPLPCPLLGQAGATGFGYATGAIGPLPANTWATIALFESLVEQNLNGSDPEIFAQFDGDLGLDPGCPSAQTWWFGTTQRAPSLAYYDFAVVVLHELAHGLGFISTVDGASGAKFQGKDDAYMRFLQDGSTGKLWPNMTDGERFASARDDGDLLWTGSGAIAAGSFLVAGRKPDGRIQMFAPSSLQPGSSVSHWDTDLTPDELMEPAYTSSTPHTEALTAAMGDIGWQLIVASGDCTADADTACHLSERFQVEVDWTTLEGSGDAQIMSFGGQRASSDQSSFWWFFNPENFEMGVKMVDACDPPFNAHWVFISGLTNQGYVVRITDTFTGLVRQYSNPLGQYPQTIGATGPNDGFPCP